MIRENSSTRVHKDDDRFAAVLDGLNPTKQNIPYRIPWSVMTGTW